jgi:hypothetical protein
MPRICTSDHSDVFPADVGQLPESQAGRLQHICAGAPTSLASVMRPRQRSGSGSEFGT